MRDKLNRHGCSSVIAYIEKLEGEHDALAAHVERLRAAGIKLRDDIDLSKIVGSSRRNFATEWDAVCEQSPATSLSRLLADAFQSAETPHAGKAGCIGEFMFVIEDGRCCPQCWHDQDDECELCNGATDERGLQDMAVNVPWDTCKRIWLAMNKIYAEQLHQQAKDGGS
ncbi:hypothetical protein CWE07_01310 [Aliidiomarina maris]|nr:hypothetical protein CWE07_01310 [Aliidiomarina maris]